MFHRIKSEPQPVAKKGEVSSQRDLVENLKAEETQVEMVEERSEAETEELSAVQRYARQQVSDMAEESEEEPESAGKDDDADTEDTAEEEYSTLSRTENELQEKEDDTMINAEADNTEAQTPEESTYSAPGRSPTGGYPGSYAGSGYTAPVAPAVSSDIPAARSQERPVTTAEANGDNSGRLVIGSGITMSGEIEACPHLVVEGTVEASLRGAEILEVSESGVFFGTVDIEQATISGRFEGDITVRGLLSVTETGHITGSITYGELEMEAGASIDGRLTPMSAAATGRSSAPAKKSAAKNAPSSSKASNDAQLFDQEAA